MVLYKGLMKISLTLSFWIVCVAMRCEATPQISSGIVKCFDWIKNQKGAIELTK